MTQQNDGQQRRVAVIGAGAAGLVSVREARSEGFEVVAYEGRASVGGIWDYHEQVEDDLLGQTPTERIHGSLYASLRTNLPRELMAYRDYPFLAKSAGDGRQYPEHAAVFGYLKDFARDFELLPHIRLNTRVLSVRALADGWQVDASDGTTGNFDAVMVCNGHYSEPRITLLPGMGDYSGLLMHSHNYRRPEIFAGMRVGVFGAGASGVDLAQEIATCAAQVHWCASIFNEGASGEIPASLVPHAAPVLFTVNGVRLADGSAIELDAFVFCTGYHFAFPFLADGLAAVDDNWVHPLYLEMIPPAHPTLAFIGLPTSVIPFPLFEYQAQWFLRRVSGQFEYPDQSAMKRGFESQTNALRAEGRKQRRYHLMADDQFDYMNLLAVECGAAPLPDWFQPMALRAVENRVKFPEQYRDMPVKQGG